MAGPGSERQDAAPTTISPRIVENIDRVLKSVRGYLGMDVAFLSEFLGANRTFRSVDSARPTAPIKVGGVISAQEGTSYTPIVTTAPGATAMTTPVQTGTVNVYATVTLVVTLQ